MSTAAASSPKKRVLIVGQGAREHALGAALRGEGHTILFAPGNAGTASLGTNHAVRADDVPAVVDLAVHEGVDLVVVGPEAPLVVGLADALTAKGVAAFGPSLEAARLEGSKAFMKDFLVRHGVPTAKHRVFDDAAAAEAYIDGAGRPLVVKADGLAAGKGVVVAKDAAEAKSAVRAMMGDRVFGAAGERVVIEEILRGEEASFHVVCDGARFVPLAPAQDHKRVFDGDAGPNTGGMGAYAPAPVVTDAVRDKVIARVIEPTLRGMAAEGRPFRGVLFAGLMIDDGEPTVLEFNVRFGDPETSVILPLYEASLFELLYGAAVGSLPGTPPPESTAHALSVVMAAEGYPGAVTTGDVIEGLGADLPEGAFVLHAGTKLDESGRVTTAGGRVLCVGAKGPTLREAARRAYAAVESIRWRGEHHRKDIGSRAFARK